ncbi:DUF1640 domain-containing protein [Rickettsiales endosymbiont of Peranema trichophorum]|uniref:DUF1640 domain-containing protein n=1 Tax=Rickettsiales endosymbiont of Peranema trichophorum TaxID=2486577 RepID=UPI001023D53F|nr:DUF1640 domain-containing protein [Rickettsiales endosymbiont of Peranema trichophorum]RZI47497.1 DUF1640 domain-containing protein [Rickettsiales endosymbiont of Peranema trichophorum]
MQPQAHQDTPFSQFVNFDTHKHFQALSQSGFTTQQAETILQSLLEARHYDISKLATQEQIMKLEFSTREQITNLDVSLNERITNLDVSLNERITNLDVSLNERITNLEVSLNERILHLDNRVASLDEKITAVRDEMKNYVTREQLLEAKHDILKWMIPLFLGLFATYIGTTIAILTQLAK